MPRTFEEMEGVLQCLHEQGSRRITLDVLNTHGQLIDDYSDIREDTFPCIALQNGVRWFFDKNRRPTNPDGLPLKALCPTGHRAMLGEFDGDATVYIFEGERDWLTAMSIGIVGAVCAGGAMNLDGPDKRRMANLRRVFVVYDNDEPGHAAGLRLCADLAMEGGREVFLAHPPTAGEDFSEWVEALTFDDTQLLGHIAQVLRSGQRVGRREARRQLQQIAEEERGPETLESDAFVAPNGDLIELIGELQRPEPWDRHVPVDVKFARLDVARTAESGLLVVDIVDRIEPGDPDAEEDPEEDTPAPNMYGGGGAPRPYATEAGMVRVPLRMNAITKRVMVLPSAVTEHGSSEALYDAVFELLSKYFCASPAFLHATTCYVLLTYRYRDAGFETVPYLRPYGDGGSGKTRLLRVMRELCFRSVFLTAVRAVHLYRTMEKLPGGCTLILEEFNIADGGTDAAEILNILNAGNQAGAMVPRYNADDKDTDFMDCFSPKIFSTEATFDNTGLLRRCISHNMNTIVVPDEKRFADLPREFYQECEKLRNKLLGWRFAKFKLPRKSETELLQYRDAVPSGLWQNWYPIIAMVPEARMQKIGTMLEIAADMKADLELVKHTSPGAMLCSVAPRVAQPNGRVYLNDMLVMLSGEDPNERWTIRKMLNALRMMQIQPKRTKTRDAESGDYVNAYWVDLGVLSQAADANKYNVDLSSAPTANPEGMPM